MNTAPHTTTVQPAATRRRWQPLVLRLLLALGMAPLAPLSASEPAPPAEPGATRSSQPYVLGESLPKQPRHQPEPDSTTPTPAPAAEEAGDTSAAPAYRYLDWEELIPRDWEPLKDFQILDFSSMADNDPRAIAALKKLQSAWKNAPLNPAIQDEAIEISGFIIPLDSSDSATIEELLLVPYFGACIHVPPPPSNQIIHVILDKPLKGFQMMDPVTVQGQLLPARTDTPYGSAGYQLLAHQIKAYEEPEDMPLEAHP